MGSNPVDELSGSATPYLDMLRKGAKPTQDTVAPVVSNKTFVPTPVYEESQSYQDLLKRVKALEDKAND